DLQQLTKRTPLVLRSETVQQVRVLAYDEVREERDALAALRQVVERAHRHIHLVRDALHIEQQLRRILFEQGAGEASDHGVWIDTPRLSHASRAIVAREAHAESQLTRDPRRIR